MASFVRNFLKSPTVKIAQVHFDQMFSLGLRLSSWVVPGALLAGWMVYPALTPNFKDSVGLPNNDQVVVSSIRYQDADEEDKMPEVA